MTDIQKQTDAGKAWEARVIKRMKRFDTYIPARITSADDIKTLDHKKLEEYIKKEGYGL